MSPRAIRKVFTQYSWVPESTPYYGPTIGPNANNAGKKILTFSTTTNVIKAAVAINVYPYPPGGPYPTHFLFIVSVIGTELILSKISEVPAVLCSKVYKCVNPGACAVTSFSPTNLNV